MDEQEVNAVADKSFAEVCNVIDRHCSSDVDLLNVVDALLIKLITMSSGWRQMMIEERSQPYTGE